MMINIFKKIVLEIKNNITEETYRFRFQLCLLYFILGCVSMVMTALNVFTQFNALFYSTLIFSVYCCIMFFITYYLKIPQVLSEIIFSVGIYSLYIFFIISGIPEGFTVIWICLLPAYGVLLFGKKNGSIISLVFLLIVIFLLDTSIGQSLLQWKYTQSFTLRFPFLYIAFYAISFFFESIRAVTQSKFLKVQDKYRYLYTHDALTKVYNRYGFDEAMQNAMNRKDVFFFFMIDIDNFKKINDEYGHLAGDYALEFIAKLIEINCNKATISRWGGEEFAGILIKNSPQDNAKAIAEELRKKIENTPIQYGRIEMKVTISMGVVTVQDKENKTSNKIIRAADDCLYQAKNQGKNCVVCTELK